MKGITYLQGDATRPAGPDGPKIIAHCCNTLGVWGAGFVLSISKRWPQPETEYRIWSKEEQYGLPLGAVQFVPVEDGAIIVANIIGQQSTTFRNGVPPIRYDALGRGLDGVAVKAKQIGATVHMPRLGCGLAGGVWALVEPLIAENLGRLDVEAFVYDF